MSCSSELKVYSFLRHRDAMLLELYRQMVEFPSIDADAFEMHIICFKAISGIIGEHHFSTDVIDVDFRGHLVLNLWKSIWNFHNIASRC